MDSVVAGSMVSDSTGGTISSTTGADSSNSVVCYAYSSCDVAVGSDCGVSEEDPPPDIKSKSPIFYFLLTL